MKAFAMLAFSFGIIYTIWRTLRKDKVEDRNESKNQKDDA